MNADDASAGSPEHGSAGAWFVTKIEVDETTRTATVTLDDGSRFELAPDAIEARGIAPGCRVDGERREALEFAASRKAAARDLFRWIDRRRRCRADLRGRLLDAGYEATVADAVLDAAQRQGLVDDRDYARAWAHDQLLRKPVGRRWLLSRLRQQGVRAEDAREGLDRLDDEVDESSRALIALRSRRLDLEMENQRAKGLRFLLGRGFDQGAALGALRERRRELAAEAEG